MEKLNPTKNRLYYIVLFVVIFIVFSTSFTKPIICLHVSLFNYLDNGNYIVYILCGVITFIHLLRCKIVNKFNFLDCIVLLCVCITCVVSLSYANKILDDHYSNCDGYVRYKENYDDKKLQLYTPFGRKIDYEKDEKALYIVARNAVGNSNIKNVSIENEKPFYDQKRYNDAQSVIALLDVIEHESYGKGDKVYKNLIIKCENIIREINNLKDKSYSNKVIVVEFVEENGDRAISVFNFDSSEKLLVAHSPMYFSVCNLYESPEDYEPRKLIRNYSKYMYGEQNTSVQNGTSGNYYYNGGSGNTYYNQPVQDNSSPSPSYNSDPYLGERCRVCEGDGDEIVNLYAGSNVSQYCEKCRKTFDWTHYHRQCQTCGGKGSY